MAADRNEFMKLYLQAQPTLRSYLAAVLRNPDAAEDVYQEVSLELWEHFDSYDPARPFVAWAIGVARHRVSHWRRTHKDQPLWLDENGEAALATAFSKNHDALSARRRALDHCLKKLNASSRNLIKLRYEDSLTLEQMAQQQGTTINVVNKSLGKIRQFLNRCASMHVQAESAATIGSK